MLSWEKGIVCIENLQLSSVAGGCRTGLVAQVSQEAGGREETRGQEADDVPIK